MSGNGHGGLYVEGSSVVHRLAPQCKVAATLGFVIAVVATPREAFWAFAALAAMVAATIGLARLPLAAVVRRLTIELPFLAFAVFLPIVGRSPRVSVLGVSLSQAGLWAAWNIIAKATLGVGAAVVLSSTTRVTDLLRGLERLHVPRVLVAICGFMVRYGDVIAAENARMHVARISRGDDPRWLWQIRALARSIGALFIRCYERGERVHLAMVARGYDGAMPALATAAPARAWLQASLLPALAAGVAAASWMWR